MFNNLLKILKESKDYNKEMKLNLILIEKNFIIIASKNIKKEFLV